MKDIMNRAHEIKYETSQFFKCDPSDIIFSICLKIAWAEYLLDQDDVCSYCEDNIIGGGSMPYHFQCEGRFCDDARVRIVEDMEFE